MSEHAPRNSKLPLLVVAVVVAVIAATMVYRHTGTEDPAVPVAQDPKDPNDPSASNLRRTRDTTASGIPLSREAVKQRQQIIAEKRKKVQAEVDRTQAAFASRYGSEPVDASWASTKQAELVELSVSGQIRELGVEPENMVVDCKTTMCRVTADFPSTSAGDDWFTLYMGNVGSKVPVASYKYIQNPDGTVTINVYALGRK